WTRERSGVEVLSASPGYAALCSALPYACGITPQAGLARQIPMRCGYLRPALPTRAPHSILALPPTSHFHLLVLQVFSFSKSSRSPSLIPSKPSHFSGSTVSCLLCASWPRYGTAPIPLPHKSKNWIPSPATEQNSAEPTDTAKILHAATYLRRWITNLPG
ncbi:hypothetical protein BDZ91DRAFT_811843, partial [Kalaharituber pfeilii]